MYLATVRLFSLAIQFSDLKEYEIGTCSFDLVDLIPPTCHMIDISYEFNDPQPTKTDPFLHSSFTYYFWKSLRNTL